MEDNVLLQLSAHAQAMMAEAKSRDSLTEAERVKAAEYTRLRLAQERHTAIGNLLTEQAAGLLNTLPEFLQAVAAIREWQEEFSEHIEKLDERLERIEGAAALMLKGLTDGALSTELKNSSHISSLKRQLIQYNRNRQKLHERLAEYGTVDAPLSITNQIDKTEDLIAELEAKLKELQGDL